VELHPFARRDAGQRLQGVDGSAVDRARVSDQAERQKPGGAILRKCSLQRRHVDAVGGVHRDQPQAFAARVETSPGDFRKRISQRAVQNISSLGGAGAGAAIQRSFLRFFETFGYDRIGLSCRLVGGVCEMGGLEEGGHGYLMVKGGGLPALNVMGYNRRVSWDVLVSRLKAIAAGNSRPVIE
jgi:hypothetical protein